MHFKELLIINPISGKGRGARLQNEIISTAKKFYPEIEIYATKRKDDAYNFIKNNAHHYNKVFVAGGDGTLNEVIKGFTPKFSFILYIIPIGSGNDFARAIQVRGKPAREIFESSLQGNYKLADYGSIAFKNHDGRLDSTNFFSSCGSGFDAQVSKISNRKTFLRGLPLYISSVLRAFTNLTFIDVEVKTDASSYQGEKLLVTVGNTATSGGGFRLTPKAEIHDNKLDIMLAEKVSVLSILKLLPLAISGKHINDPRVIYTQIESAHIRYKSPAVLQCDGELLSEQVIESTITINKSAIKVGI